MTALAICRGAEVVQNGIHGICTLNAFLAVVTTGRKC